MFDSILYDIKSSFRSGNMITRLIMINCIVFVTVALIKVFNYDWQLKADGTIYNWLVNENLALSADIVEVLYHPWTLITHMFLHEGLWHIAINMLWLYWMGRILGDLLGDKKILPTYILGGLFGGLVYILSAMLITGQVMSFAVGASAAVMAITLAAAVTSPNYGLRLILLGDVKLKYIALAAIVIDLLYLTASNTGGHFAHLGGAFFGWLSVVSLRKGYSLTAPLEKFFDRPFKSSKPKTNMKVAHKSTLIKQKKSSIKVVHKSNLEVDKILEKIKKKGLESLSKEERQVLDKESKK